MNGLLTALKTEPWFLKNREDITSVIAMIEQGKVAPKAQFGMSNSLPMPEASIESGIAFIPIAGMITRRWSWFGTSLREVEDTLLELMSRDDVHSVLFTVDSPGGQVLGFPEIAELIAEVGKTKRCVAWIDAVGASAAYYMACATDEVYALGSAIVGSIGCVASFVDDSANWEMNGMRLEAFASAPGKLRAMEGKPFTDEDREFFQNRVMEFGTQFRNFVAARRPAATEYVLTSGDYGTAATWGIENGLIDATYTTFAHMFADVFGGGQD